MTMPVTDVETTPGSMSAPDERTLATGPSTVVLPGEEVGGASEEVGAVMLEQLLQRGDQIEGAAEENAVDLL
jgi:hypothetical protein